LKKAVLATMLFLLLTLAALAAAEEVYLYHPESGMYAGSEKKGNALSAEEEMSGACPFTMEEADGYLLFSCAKGYLTSDISGNGLYFSKEKTAYSMWKAEDAGSGEILLRNRKAEYGSKAQYLEYYNGKFTTYGLKSGSSAFVFEIVSENASKASDEASVQPFTLAVIHTGDIHGRLYHTDYASGKSGGGQYGLTRAASLIREAKSQYENTLLIDIGDTIQGTPLTWYYAFEREDAPDPAVKALRALQYDCWIPGNHEFNFGLDILNRQIAYAESPAKGNESRVSVLAANFVLDGTAFDTWAGAVFEKEFRLGRESVRVGVIGLSSPNIPNWEPKTHYEGLDFRNFPETYKYYEDSLADCDIVIAACHSGIEDDAVLLPNGEYRDRANQIRALVENTRGIDLVLAGHTHETGVRVLKNADGEKVPVVFAGRYAQNIGLSIIGLNPETGETTVDAYVVSAEGAKADKALSQTLAPYEEECFDRYLNEVIGISAGSFYGAGNMTQPTAFMDLVNRAQIAGCFDKEGHTATALDDEAPDFSISAPPGNGSGRVIGEGDITLGDLYSLYRFENWLYSVYMTGPEIRAWLEGVAARQYSYNADGSITGGGVYADCLYGEDLSYEIDLSRREGNRVVSLTWKGKPLSDSEYYTVVLNNYRYTNGGSYLTYVQRWLSERGYPEGLVESENGLLSISPERTLFSTQFDIPSGDDAGQVRALIESYIKEETVLFPDVSSDWIVY